MKRSLRFASIAFLLFATNASALKQPPPGAGSGTSNVLVMIENSYYTHLKSGASPKDLPVHPSDLVIDSSGNLHVKNNNWRSGRYYTTTNYYLEGIYGDQCRNDKTCYPADGRISKLNSALVATGTYGESRSGKDGFGLSTTDHASRNFGAGDIAIERKASGDTIYVLIRNNQSSGKLSDARIDKYDTDGKLLDVIPLSNDKKYKEILGYPLAIDVDERGDIWVVGTYTSTRKCDRRNPEINCGSSNDGPNGYIARYDPDGVLLHEPWHLPWRELKKGKSYLRAITNYYAKAISVHRGEVYVLQTWEGWGPTPAVYPYKKFLGNWGAINSEFPYPECQIGFPVHVYDAADLMAANQTYDTDGFLLTGSLHKASWYALGGEDLEVNDDGVYVVGHKTFHTKNTIKRGNKTGDADGTLQYLWDDPIDDNNDGIPDVRYGPDCGGQAGKYTHGGDLVLRFAPRKIFCDDSTVAAPAGLATDVDGNIYVMGVHEIPTHPPYGPKYGSNQNNFTEIKKYSPDGQFLGTTDSSEAPREDLTKCALRKVLANPDITNRVNLGLQVFSQEPKMQVGVSPSGASEIRPMMCHRCPIDPRWRNKKTWHWYNGSKDGLSAERDSIGDDWTAYDMRAMTEDNKTQFVNPQTALNHAKDYFANSLAGDGFPSPIDPNSCESQAVLLISSTPWPYGGAIVEPLAAGKENAHPHPTSSAWAQEMAALGVRTYIVSHKLPEAAWTNKNHGGSWCYKANKCKTFEEDLNTHTKLSKAVGTYPVSPQIVTRSDGVDELATAIETLLLQSAKSDLVFTGTTPAIASDAAGDYIYQSTFTLPATGQWRGKLAKFALDSSTGSVGDQEWEAGAELNLVPAVDRRIWTSGTGIASGLNNFVSTNVGALKAMLYAGVSPAPTDDEASKLINFVRGQDSYDEDGDTQTTDQRQWKLGDIYHSEMAIVGPPNAIDTDKASDTNTEEFFKLQNGYQAFIDDNASRETMVYVGANDGMLHAFKDSTGEELWGFIPPNVLSKLRSMVSGVEHVTNPIYGVDGSPVVKDIYYNGQWRTILMAGLGREGFGYFALDVTDPSSPRFLFAFENDPENQKIRHWTANGFLTEQDYAGVSSAFDYRKLGEALSTPTIFMTSDRTFVAAIGGGLNNTVDKDYGSARYLIDLENQGKVFFRNDLADVSGGLNNSHPAQVTAVTADTTSAATYKGAMLYSADLQSKLTKINHNAMSGCNGCNRSVDIDMLWTEGDQFGNDALSFNPVTASIDSADTLWIYFGTGNLDRLQSSVATVQNRIFAKKDFNFPGAGSGGGVYWTSPGFKDVTLPGATCPTDSDTGWYINLGSDEKVTNKIQIEDGVLFAPLYTPDTAQSCFPGTSTVAEFGYDCGKLVRRTVLGAGQIAGVRIFKDKIYGGVSGVPDTGSNTEVQLNNEFKQKGSIISGTPAQNSSNASGTPVPTVTSWREVF